MPSIKNGNKCSQFTDLIAVEQLGSHKFRSKALAFAPANGIRTYGGHVYMQACYAASRTVAKDFVLHNVTGWFLMAGIASERFTYSVRTIRDGGISTRGVDVVQESDPGICFTCICSFKRPERASIPTVEIQQQLDLENEFKVALHGKRPDQHPLMPGVDAPWYWEWQRSNGGYTDPFPGLRLHKVDMDAYNEGKSFDEKRSLKYYAAEGPMPSMKEDPNMHVCAHLYASDRNSLFVISNHVDIGDDYSQIASLAHTVIFHGDAAELDMVDHATDKARWFCQEAWTGGARQGRGTHQSHLWRDDGVHIATTLQDGMVRLKRPDGEGRPGFSPEAMSRQMEVRRKSVEKL